MYVFVINIESRQVVEASRTLPGSTGVCFSFPTSLVLYMLIRNQPPPPPLLQYIYNFPPLFILFSHPPTHPPA